MTQSKFYKKLIAPAWVLLAIASAFTGDFEQMANFLVFAALFGAIGSLHEKREPLPLSLHQRSDDDE